MVTAKYGYLSRKEHNRKRIWRDWWLVKQSITGGGELNLFPSGGKLLFPPQYVGKRVRFKVEIIENKTEVRKDDIKK